MRSKHAFPFLYYRCGYIAIAGTLDERRALHETGSAGNRNHIDVGDDENGDEPWFSDDEDEDPNPGVINLGTEWPEVSHEGREHETFHHLSTAVAALRPKR